MFDVSLRQTVRFRHLSDGWQDDLWSVRLGLFKPEQLIAL
jgi:hypothetical protein